MRGHARHDESGRIRPTGGDHRLPLYVRLRDDLAAKIAAGTWKPGVPLPSEAALAESYKVSLGTVRHAIQELVREGVLERRQGSGTFLRRPDFSSSWFRFLRFQKRNGEAWLPESRILSRTVVGASEEAAAHLGIAAGAEAIRMSRLRLYDGEPLVAEEIWLPLTRFKPFLDVPLERVGPLLYRVYEDVCGQMAASAEETLFVSIADKACARLLGVPPQAPVVVIERLARSHDGAPLEWRRSHGRADRFVYKIEIR